MSVQGLNAEDDPFDDGWKKIYRVIPVKERRKLVSFVLTGRHATCLFDVHTCICACLSTTSRASVRVKLQSAGQISGNIGPLSKTLQQAFRVDPCLSPIYVERSILLPLGRFERVQEEHLVCLLTLLEILCVHARCYRAAVVPMDFTCEVW